MSDDREKLLSGEAWREWCRRLEAVGDRILGEEFPSGARERSEGYRAITRLLAHALQTEVEYGDPRFPTLVRYEEPHTQWGGPNPDNIYLRAAIDPAYAYRIWGNVKDVRQAIFSLQEGDMQLQQYGVFSECSFEDLEIAEDGALEIFIGGDEHAPRARAGAGLNRMPLPAKARIFQVRIYQSDWQNDSVGRLQIERVGGEGVPPEAVDAAELTQGLDRAMTWVEASIPYWNRYTAAGAERATPNVATPAQSTPGGADNIEYGSCFWDLAQDEALLITCEEPEAQYWSFCIHTLGWLESGDFANRQVSLSGHQVHVDDDGRVRVVLSQHDPGVPNWIDTEGRRRGLFVYRQVWATTSPTPSSEVVPLAKLRARLPDGHPVIDADARRAALSRRRELALRRYR